MDDCFVHASDLHLDAPLGSLGRLDLQRRAILAGRASKAWGNLVDLCIRREASFLVLAGDIFDRAAAGVGVQSSFRKGLKRLAEAGVRVFICHGNHDPLSDAFKPIGGLPEGVVRFEPGVPQSHVVTLRHSRDPVRVSGVSFGTQHEKENLALRFRDLEPDPAAAHAPHVAVLHANVGGNPGHDPYAPCSYDDLDGAGVDYWALGHIHKRNVRELPSGARAAYCGNLQGRSFKASECEPKGALVVPIGHGRIGDHEFEPCDEVRFVHDEIPVAGDTVADLQDRLEQTAEQLGCEHAPRPVALRVRLAGRSNEARRLAETADSGELYQALTDDLSELLGGGGLCGVQVAVRADADRDAIMASGDLRASVLRDLQGLRPGDDPSLAKMLRDELPSQLRTTWQEIVEQRPERLAEVVDLAETLILDAFSATGSETT